MAHDDLDEEAKRIREYREQQDANRAERERKAQKFREQLRQTNQEHFNKNEFDPERIPVPETNPEIRARLEEHTKHALMSKRAKVAHFFRKVPDYIPSLPKVSPRKVGYAGIATIVLGASAMFVYTTDSSTYSNPVPVVESPVEAVDTVVPSEKPTETQTPLEELIVHDDESTPDFVFASKKTPQYILEEIPVETSQSFLASAAETVLDMVTSAEARDPDQPLICVADASYSSSQMEDFRSRGCDGISIKGSLYDGHGLDSFFSRMDITWKERDALMKDTTIRHSFTDKDGDGYGDVIPAGFEFTAEYVFPAKKPSAIPVGYAPQVVVADENITKVKDVVDNGVWPLKYFGQATECVNESIIATGIENGFAASADRDGDGLFDYWQAGQEYTMVIVKDCGLEFEVETSFKQDIGTDNNYLL